MGTTTKQPWTADELGRLPAGWRYEIDEGELVITAPPGYEHGRLLSRVDRLLGNFVEAHHLGEVVSGEVGFRLQRRPEVLRGVDVAFVAKDREARITDSKGFSDVWPDLAVEIHLPDERDMQHKVQQYLAAGVHSVWVVDPRGRTLTQHSPGREPKITADMDATVTDQVLPGFACRLRNLFGA